MAFYFFVYLSTFNYYLDQWFRDEMLCLLKSLLQCRKVEGRVSDEVFGVVQVFVKREGEIISPFERDK